MGSHPTRSRSWQQQRWRCSSVCPAQSVCPAGSLLPPVSLHPCPGSVVPLAGDTPPRGTDPTGGLGKAAWRGCPARGGQWGGEQWWSTMPFPHPQGLHWEDGTANVARRPSAPPEHPSRGRAVGTGVLLCAPPPSLAYPQPGCALTAGNRQERCEREPPPPPPPGPVFWGECGKGAAPGLSCGGGNSPGGLCPLSGLPAALAAPPTGCRVEGCQRGRPMLRRWLAPGQRRRRGHRHAAARRGANQFAANFSPRWDGARHLRGQSGTRGAPPGWERVATRLPRRGRWGGCNLPPRVWDRGMEEPLGWSRGPILRLVPRSTLTPPFMVGWGGRPGTGAVWGLEKGAEVLPWLGYPIWVLGCSWQRGQLCFSRALQGLGCVDTAPVPPICPLLWGGGVSLGAPQCPQRHRDRQRLSRSMLLYNSHLLFRDLIPEKSTNS